MRNVFVLCVLFLLLADSSFAIGKRRYRGEPKTEVDLIYSVVSCLQHKDTAAYYNLFPPFDTLWHMVIHNADQSPESQKQLANLREHPQTLIEFDPMYNKDIMNRFRGIIQKGEDSGMLWSAVSIQRYQLMKDEITNHSLAGYSRIAPERFKGFIFVRDVMNRVNFCITITEIQKIHGDFVGGQLINILEASSIDEYYLKEKQEQQYFAWLAAHPFADSAAADSSKTGTASTDTVKAGDKKGFLNVTAIEDEETHVRREVIDRKYYEGKFDDEIPVKLYIRYMRDVGNNKKMSFDGLYKFGDQKSYVRLEIVRNADGKWVMDDDTPLGTLELELKDKIFTGSWTNNESQAGYDAVLKQTGVAQKKLELMDEILDKNRSGRIDEQPFEMTDEDKKTGDNADDDKAEKKANSDKKASKEDTDEKDRKADEKARKKAEKLQRRKNRGNDE